MTDERYLNATLNDIYEDYLLFRLSELREFFSERVPEAKGEKAQITQEEFDKMNEDDINDIKMCKANYATAEEIAEYEARRKGISKTEYDSKMNTEQGRLDLIEQKIMEIHEQKLNNNGK